MRASRRSILRTTLLGLGAAAAGAAATRIPDMFGPDRLPLSGGYAAAADNPGAVRHPTTSITYYVDTAEPVVAFTFDDGPGPRWTPMVLDALDAHNVPATFFMVGRNLETYADLVRGRLGRHEVANHSWSHPDLAKLDLEDVRRQITRTHETIAAVTGRQTRLLRPPYGHFGGSTILAADSLGYDVVLWSRQMREKVYAKDPSKQVEDIVNSVRPGDIVLAHDVGRRERLVALNNLGAMFTGLRARGFRFVTVSELRALQRPAPPPPAPPPLAGPPQAGPPQAAARR